MTLATRRRWFALGLLAVSLVTTGAFFVERMVRRPGIPKSEPREMVMSNAVALNPVRPGELRPILDDLEKVTSGGKLDDIDYRAIRWLVAKQEGLIERNIQHIDVLKPDKIEVRTGPKVARPLSGGGHILTMERRGQGWVVVRTDFWVG